MSNKRRKLADLEDIPTVRAYLPDEAIADLPPPGSAAAARLVGQLADLLGVPDHEIEEARVSYPSFSGAKWQCVGGRYNLPRRFPHGAAFASLEQVFEAAWKAADVYGDARFQTQEAARLRVLDPYIVGIVSLFHGRIVDFPGRGMPETADASGGEVQHEMVSVAGSLFFVIGVNQLTMNNAKYHAQLFSELLSAAKRNADDGLGQNMRVHGLLPDLSDFRFYSYDLVEQKFATDGHFMVGGERRA